jgi:hypothetical protein
VKVTPLGAAGRGEARRSASVMILLPMVAPVKLSPLKGQNDERRRF